MKMVVNLIMINRKKTLRYIAEYLIALAIVRVTVEICKAHGSPVWLGIIVVILEAIMIAFIRQVIDQAIDKIEHDAALKKLSKEDLHIHAVIPNPEDNDGKLQLLCALSMSTSHGDPEEYLKLIEDMNTPDEKAQDKEESE